MPDTAKPTTRARTLRRRLALILLLAAATVLVDALIIEPRAPVLSTYHVAVPNLPARLDGYRIVQLSDIHRRAAVPDSAIRKAVALANSTHADAAVLTGDFVGKGSAHIEPCFGMLAQLRTKRGSYAVLGNHDHWGRLDEICLAMRRHGVKLLNNSNAQVERGLYLVGIDDLWSGTPDVPSAFAGIDPGKTCVMLSHTPQAADLFRGHDGLLITGHTHGGQVQIPLIPRNRLPGLKGWKYIEGWYRVGGVLMYVNRGIGMIIPPVRFRCRPEVTLFVLHRASDNRARLVPAHAKNAP